MKPDDAFRAELDRLVRRERGRLLADLVHRLGPHQVDLAEDVAQEALVAAMAVWPYQGLPDKPGAWLARVARNKAYDRLRRQVREAVLTDEPASATGDDASRLFEAAIGDPELRLVFLCCHSSLTEQDRLALTLKLVSGFTARDIGQLLLASDAAIGQRLARVKRKLKALGPSIRDAPSRFGIARRVPTALKVVYLMFSLGHAPRRGSKLVQQDVAMEALRLSRVLADDTLTGCPRAQALAALLCFHASRLGARQDAEGNVVLLPHQDRNAWDRRLIDGGLGYLAAAREATELSRYHLEAGIAALHATAGSWERTDWDAIVRLYGQLEAMTESPVVAVNASVALAMAGQETRAMTRLDALDGLPALKDYAPYYVARAEVLSRLGRADDAADAFSAALACGVSAPVSRHLEARLGSCL